MLRPYILAICRELQIWATCIKYMTALKRFAIHAEHFDQTGNSLKIAGLYDRKM